MPIETIAASEEGGKRRRAEYVILVILDDKGALELEELENAVMTVHNRLIESNRNSPFYFRGGGSNGPVSREFDSSIDRLLQYNRMEKDNTRKYVITDLGVEYLANDSKLERHNIDEGFREFIREIAGNI